MNTQKENKQETKENIEETLNKAFEESLKYLKAGLNFNRNKLSAQSETIGYALSIYIGFGNITPLKRLLIGTNLYRVYESYLEYIGLFLKYNAKTDFLKAIKEEESLITGDFESLPTFKAYKEKIEEKEVKPIDYNKRLETLFKKLSKSEAKNILESFIETLNKTK